MSRIYLPKDASRAQLKAAHQAQGERRGIIQALSHGQVSRRDLIKMGLFTGAGMLAPIRGLNPFVPNLLAQTPGGPGIPTGLPRSPLFGVAAFSQPMPRFDVLPRKAVNTLTPAPTCEANTIDRYEVDPCNGGGTGPAEGRPPGPMWAHQKWDQFPPQVAVEVSQMGNKAANTVYNPSVSPSQVNLMGMGPSSTLPRRAGWR